MWKRTSQRLNRAAAGRVFRGAMVFTVPAELRQLVRAHQKMLLGVLFRAAFTPLAGSAVSMHHLCPPDKAMQVRLARGLLMEAGMLDQ